MSRTIIGWTDNESMRQLRENEVVVYNDTGRAGYTISSQLTGTIRGVNTLDDFFVNPVHHFSPPRQILLGLTATF